MKLFEYAWFTDFHGTIEDLKLLAMKEDWDYKNSPIGKNPILENYIKHTFIKLYEEHKVLEQKGYSLFNTGLVTDYQEEIFALCQKNKRPGSIQWFFLGWRKASDRDLMKFTSLPENANYFENSSDLIYDTKLELRTNVNHIIDDNIARFPKALQSMDKYKTAVPQYYDGRLQLLLPLCLTSKASADLALVIEKENGVYRASTCLTLDMAINNARLIAKPDDEWLKV